MNPIKKNHDAMLRTGAMALAAAGASTAAHAATVQITFNNSFVSTSSGTATLDTDFGGDGVHDLFGTVGAGFVQLSRPGVGGFAALAFAGGVPGVYLKAQLGYSFGIGWVGVDSATYTGLVAFSLGDSSVRMGEAISGWVDVTATAGSAGGVFSGRLDVHRFIFDDASGVAPTGVSHASAAFPEYVAAVPEPSGLCLLALGAGALGLLERRARRTLAGAWITAHPGRLTLRPRVRVLRPAAARRW